MIGLQDYLIISSTQLIKRDNDGFYIDFDESAGQTISLGEGLIPAIQESPGRLRACYAHSWYWITKNENGHWIVDEIAITGNDEDFD